MRTVRGAWRALIPVILATGCGGGPEPQPGPGGDPAPSPQPSASPTPAERPAPVVDPAFADLLDREDRRVRDPDAWADLLAHDDEQVRLRAARAVGRVRAQSLAAALLGRLADEGSSAVRQELVFALGQVGAEEARESLVGLLTDDDGALATQAARALGKLPLSAATVLALTRCAVPGETPALAHAAILSLVRLRGRRANPDTALDPDAEAVLEEVLLQGSRGDDPELRWRSVFALSEIEIPGRRELLVEALQAADPLSRLFAARGLKRIDPVDDAVHGYAELETVVERLGAERDPHVAAALCDLLAARENPYALAALEEAVQRHDSPADHHVRHAAVVAARKILSAHEGEERVADEDIEHGRNTCRHALRDPSPRVRAAALLALARLRDLDAPGISSAFAQHEDLYDRIAAAESASELPDAAASPLLARLVRDPAPAVICAALGDLGERAERVGEGQDVRRWEAREAAKTVLKTSDVAARSVALALLGDVGLGDDVAAMATTYERAEWAGDVEVRQEALRAAAALTLRLRAEATSVFSPALRASMLTSALLRNGLKDPSLAVRAVAADQLEALYGKRPEVPPPSAGTSTAAVVPGVDLLLASENPRVLLQTSKGELELELLREEAPRHVASFLRLAQSGFFDGLVFHRVVSGFVAQGLDPRGDGWGTGDVVLHDEINDVPFLGGVVGMPNSGPDTGGCQVFLTHVPTPHLDGSYTVFGRVLTGMDVLHALDVGDRCLGVTVR
jgi:cyclophilin family peptidyl-prolyl cis-trans isomerase/HEAT repeat protein